jgi:hypothetical protein
MGERFRDGMHGVARSIRKNQRVMRRIAKQQFEMYGKFKRRIGGCYWDRTSDPRLVRAMLSQLS